MAESTKGKEMMTSSVQFPMLSATNYTVWAMRMKVALKVHKVWGVIDSGDSDPEKNDLATALIFQSIPETLILQIGEQDTAKDMWDAIKTRAEQARLQTLNSEFDIFDDQNSQNSMAESIMGRRCSPEDDIFNDQRVNLYWNMEDYPIPESGEDRCSISHNIISALRIMGSTGCMVFHAFGPNLDQQRESLVQAGFVPIEPEEYSIGEQGSMSVDEAICRIILFRDSLEHNLSNRGTPKVYIVIAKPKPDSQLPRVLKCLQARCATVVLVEPPEDDNLFPTPEAFLECAQLLGGSTLSTMERHGISDGFDQYDPTSETPFDRMVVVA